MKRMQMFCNKGDESGGALTALPDNWPAAE